MLRAKHLLRSSADLKGPDKPETADEKIPRVLVVTGDPYVLRALEENMTEMGYVVDSVRGRGEAEQYLNRRKPKMIICDTDLPVDEAYELCHFAKKTPATASIPFVFVTTKGEFPDKKIGFESGADDYVTKPLNSAEIKNRIGPLLRRGEMGKRGEFFGEEKKPPRGIPDPTEILREIRAREETTKKPEKARLSSMEFVKNHLKDRKRGIGKAVSTVEAEEEKAVEAVYQNSVKAVTGWMNSLLQGKIIDLEEVEKTSGALLEKMNSNSLLVKITRDLETEKDVACRSVNITILSLRIGRRLGYSEDKLIQLGTAALLHLVGLKKLLEYPELTVEELEKEPHQYLKEYPSVGVELLRSSVEKQGEQKYTWLLDVVLQVEEREDGQGTPQNLKGEQIHEYAKIIAVSKRYLDLIHPLFSTEKMIPSEAVKHIIEMQRSAFSSQIVNAFVKEVSIFPVGSWVQLSSGEKCMVMSNNPTHPLRPVVKVFYGPKGEGLPEGRIVNLVDTPFTFITKAISEEELPER